MLKVRSRAFCGHTFHPGRAGVVGAAEKQRRWCRSTLRLWVPADTR